MCPEGAKCHRRLENAVTRAPLPYTFQDLRRSGSQVSVHSISAFVRLMLTVDEIVLHLLSEHLEEHLAHLALEEFSFGYAYESKYSL